MGAMVVLIIKRVFLMASKAIYAIAGLFIGAIVDVLVNLLAAGIQQQAFLGQFSMQALWILAGLAVLGLLIGYWLAGKVEVSAPSSALGATTPVNNKTNTRTITRLIALLSYSKLKGKGIHLSDIFLFGSRIDIED
jgi:hypothetical protein